MDKRVYMKAYYIKNKDKLTAYRNRPETKAKLIEYYRIYNEVNKVKLKAYKKAYRILHREKIDKYTVEYQLENFDKIHTYQAKYRETNKEHLEKYREDHKEEAAEKAAEKVSCECGRDITWGNIARHKKSKFHRRFFGEVV